MTRRQQALRFVVRVVLLFLFGFALGILIRTQYFGDDLVWIWNT